jgi:DeoR/GlpR family transcriptional regulator of sugar metabolism
VGGGAVRLSSQTRQHVAASGKQAIARASAAIVVADAGKHARAALARIAAPERFRHLVTDAPPPPTLGQAMTQAGLAVLLAGAAAAAA